MAGVLILTYGAFWGCLTLEYTMVLVVCLRGANKGSLSICNCTYFLSVSAGYPLSAICPILG